jgi:hypothetical protein
MRIELEARAAGGRDAQARACVELGVADRPASAPPRWIGSAVTSIIGTAGAITALPEISARLSPRAVLILHFIATVGTSAQPLIVTVIAALIAAVEHAVRRRCIQARTEPRIAE